jgi:hypothetical protein
MKQTSATGYLRFSQNPNLRSQDGLKYFMLCKDCEERFNIWETQFSKYVFYPLTQNADTAVYADWMIRFCTSVSWRVLKWYLENNHMNHVQENLMPVVEQCESRWRQFMLGECVDLGRHQQHFLPLGTIESHTFTDMPSNINRYFLRAVDMDIISGEETALVYSKIGPFIILGFAEMPYPAQWIGTQVQLNRGTIEPRDYTLPSQFGEFLMQKAERMANTTRKYRKSSLRL